MIIVLIGTVGTASASQASVVSTNASGSVLVYDDVSDEGVDEATAADVSVSLEGLTYTIVDNTSPITELSSACESEPGRNNTVHCSALGIELVAVSTESGDDTVSIDVLTDTMVCGGEGVDILTGGAGDDGLMGGPGRDTLSGGPGVDSLIAEVDGLPPNSTGAIDPSDCFGPLGDGSADGDVLDGGDGQDFLFGGPGPDTMRGGAASDSIFGFSGHDEISGGADADLLVGLDGADQVLAGEGNDILSGGADDDVLLGDGGADDIGATVFLEANGAEFATVEDGNDTLEGGPGDDGLAGGPVGPNGAWVVGYLPGEPLPSLKDTAEGNGADTLRGGPGRDHLTYGRRTGQADLTLDAARNDGAPAEGDLIESDIERLTGGPGPNRMVGDAGDNVLDGGEGADEMEGGPGADTLAGGTQDEAADRLDGGPGPDALDGGPGDDTLAGGGEPDALRGGGGSDDLGGGDDDDLLMGGPGGDNLRTSAGADTFDGEDGVDTADYGAASAPVTVILDGLRNDGEDARDLVTDVENVRGGSAGDELRGDAVPNRLDGGPGDDFVDGRAGADTLRGGAGRDAMRARDGGPDTVACGPGSDLAVVDRADQVASSGAEGCEREDTGRTRRPRARRTALVAPENCRLGVRFPRPSRVFPVEDRITVPLGALIVSERCGGRITTAGRSLSAATLRTGAVAVRQTGRRRPRTVLTLMRGGFSGCAGTPASASRAVRRVELKLRGAFLVRARYAKVRARKATMVVEDRCRVTLVRVRRGVARVRDADGGRWHTVKRGQRHLARGGSG